MRLAQHRLSTLHEDMHDQEAVEAINSEISKEQLQSMLQRGSSTSFIFSIKNRIGGLARVLKVFQVKKSTMTKIFIPLCRRLGPQHQHRSYRIAFVSSNEFGIRDLRGSRGGSRPHRTINEIVEETSFVRRIRSEHSSLHQRNADDQQRRSVDRSTTAFAVLRFQRENGRSST